MENIELKVSMPKVIYPLMCDKSTWFWDEQEVDELTPEEYQQFIDGWNNFRNSFRDLATKFNRRHPANRGDVNQHGLPHHLRTNNQ